MKPPRSPRGDSARVLRLLAHRIPVIALGFALHLRAFGAADDPALLPQITKQIEQLQAEKRGRSKGRKKLASALIDAERARRLGRASDAVQSLESSLAPDGAGSVLVDLSADVSPGLLAEIERAGGTVLHHHEKFRAIRARLPLAALEALAERNDVRFIRPAVECRTNAGPLDSEGNVAHRVNSARTMFGVDGTGVKVGVLSDSADHLAGSQARGELPSASILPGQSGIGFGFGEGTAMLEIVHDIAPGAELFFATAFTGDTEFASNIRDLAAAGCSVIIDDVTYFNESPFQDGVISQAVNDVSAQGVLYFSSAGNSGNLNDGTSGTWEGDFADGGAAPTGPTARLHDFGGGTVVNLVTQGGSSRRVDLFWSDPLGGAGDDYDVYVANSQGRIVRRSDATQDGNDDPYESINFLQPGEGIMIVKSSGAGRFLHLDTGRGTLTLATSGVTRGHNASGAPNAFCVAATRAAGRTTPFTTSDNVEFFSSDGPRHIFYNPDGSAITPGDVSASGGAILQKPDITAADGVVTSVPFFESFFGTSAAAPHAGAIAAVLKSFKPTLTAAQIRTALQGTALDIEGSGFDRDSGSGILDAFAALQSVANVVNQSPVVTTSGGAAAFTENGAPVTIDAAIAITDVDSTSFNGGSLVAEITANGEAKDLLAIRHEGFGAGQVGVVPGNLPSNNFVTFGGETVGTFASIAGSNNASLLINFNSFAASPAVATAFARSITYVSTSENPGAAPRTVRFIANDGKGGVSGPATRIVSVTPINDAPSFTKGPDQVVVNDTTVQVVGNWATNVSAGKLDEASQALTFQVTNDNNALFASQPAVGTNRTLVFQPSGTVGSATVTVTLMDDGGTAGGGVNTSAAQTFHIFYNAGNIPPSFVKGPDITVATDTGPTVLANWATNISPGPANENAQQIDFLVETNATLFTVAPTVSASGALGFTPKPHASGIATVTVRAHDSGGIANGGLDTSDPQTFIIAIASFAEEIGIFNGLILPAAGTTAEFARHGLARAVVSRTGGLSAKLTLGGMSFAVKGKLAGAGGVTFGRQNAPTVALLRPGLSALTLALALDTTLGTDQLNGSLVDGASAFANLLADRAAYSQRTPAPAGLAGKYTAVFPAHLPLVQGLAASQFPQGDGAALGGVSAAGIVKFKAALADGSKVAFTSALSKSNTLPFHVLTDNKHGSITGRVAFRDVSSVSDFDSAGLIWFKPPGGTVYPAGFLGGIHIGLIGSHFMPGAPALPGLSSPGSGGNARVTLSDAGLASEVPKSVNIIASNRVVVIDRDDDRLALKINGRTGAFGGKFTDPETRKTAKIRGVIFQKQALGSGFFLNGGESGAVSLAPNVP